MLYIGRMTKKAEEPIKNVVETEDELAPKVFTFPYTNISVEAETLAEATEKHDAIVAKQKKEAEKAGEENTNE
jgi:hypothetical protein